MWWRSCVCLLLSVLLFDVDWIGSWVVCGSLWFANGCKCLWMIGIGFLQIRRNFFSDYPDFSWAIKTCSSGATKIVMLYLAFLWFKLFCGRLIGWLNWLCRRSILRNIYYFVVFSAVSQTSIISTIKHLFMHVHVFGCQRNK